MVMDERIRVGTSASCHRRMRSVSVSWCGWGGASAWVSHRLVDSALADVTLVAEGRSLRAHRLLLAATSRLFRDIFEQNPVKHPIIVLQDVSYEGLQNILSYIYNGEVSVTEDFLPSLIKAGEHLKIVGLYVDTELDKGPNSSSVDDYMQHDYIKEEVESSSLRTDEVSLAINPSDVVQVETVIKEEREELINDDHQHRDIYHENTIRCIKKQEKRKHARSRSKKKSRLRLMKCNERNNLSIKESLGSLNKENENLVPSNYNNDDIAVHNEHEPLDSNTIEQILGNKMMNNTGGTFHDHNDHFNETIREDSRQTFPCPFCSRVYYSWGYRRRHVKTHHESNSLTCKICFDIMNSEVMWFEHVVNIHGMPHNQARDSLVVMVEAHSVLTIATSPPSAVSMLDHLQLDTKYDSDTSLNRDQTVVI